MVMLIIVRLVIAVIAIAALVLLANYLFGRKKKVKEGNPLINKIGTETERLDREENVAREAEAVFEHYKEAKEKDPEGRLENVREEFEGGEEKEEEPKDGKTRQPKTRKKRGTK